MKLIDRYIARKKSISVLIDEKTTEEAKAVLINAEIDKIEKTPIVSFAKEHFDGTNESVLFAVFMSAITIGSIGATILHEEPHVAYAIFSVVSAAVSAGVTTAPFKRINKCRKIVTAKHKLNKIGRKISTIENIIKEKQP